LHGSEPLPQQQPANADDGQNKTCRHQSKPLPDLSGLLLQSEGITGIPLKHFDGNRTALRGAQNTGNDLKLALFLIAIMLVED
jgi:hypothetical protein